MDCSEYNFTANSTLPPHGPTSTPGGLQNALKVHKPHQHSGKTASAQDPHLEQALVVAQHIAEQAAAGGPARQQAPQNGPVGQHQLPQDVVIMDAWEV